MSLNIGQLKRADLNNNFGTPITITSNNFTSSIKTSLTEELEVSDIGFVFSKPFEKNKNYYFSFYANRNWASNDFDFIITLYGNGREMPLKRFTAHSNFSFCEVIFSPNDVVYNTIILKVVRATSSSLNYQVNIDSATEENSNKEYKNIKLYQLSNIVKELSGVNYIKKLGIQANPGFAFCMNGEEIRVGKTGIYEVEGISIDNLAFVIKEAPSDSYGDEDLYSFIMDYLY